MRALPVMLVVGLALLAGCRTPPPAPLVTPTSSLVEAAVGGPFPEAWWTVFQDPELDRLVGLAREQNRELAQALARIDEARARARIAGADAALQVEGRAQASRTRLSESVDNPLAPGPRDDFSLGVDLAYEVDIWGRLRNQREAALRQVEVSELDRAALELSLLGRVAAAYFEYRAAVREEALLERQLSGYGDSISLQTARSQAGLASDLELERIRVEQSTREGDRAVVAQRAREARHALALLCGMPPEELVISDAVVEARVHEVPSTLALPLLEARPDVASARAGWEAAVARVAQTRAALYPQIRLTGTLGYEAGESADLFDWQSRLASLVGGLTAPLLDGGRLRGRVAVEEAQLRAAALAYEQSVLTAYREVADGLQLVQSLARRQVSAETGRAAANRALELSRDRYAAGYVSYLEVVESERSLLASDRLLAQLGAQRQRATVDLIRALGLPGGTGR